MTHSSSRFVVMVMTESDFRLYMIWNVDTNIYHYTEHLLRGGRDNLGESHLTITKDSEKSMYVDLSEQELADYYGGVDGFIEIYYNSAHVTVGGSRFFGRSAFAYFDGETVDWVE